MTTGRDAEATLADERLADSGDQRSWIVLLEATPSAEASLMDAEVAYALLEAMGAEDAVGLHCRERVAVQVSVCGVDVAAAVSAVLSRWRETATRLALQGWDVVRAEAVTPEEFKRQCEVS